MRDFLPDYFSMKPKMLHRLKNEDELVIRQIMSLHYESLGKIESINRFSSLERNSNNFKILTEQGQFVLKRWNHPSESRLKEIIDIQLKLNARHILVPKPERVNDRFFFSDNSGHFISLCRYIDGELYNPSTSNISSFFHAMSELFLELKILTGAKPIRSSFEVSPLRIIESISGALRSPSFWRSEGLQSKFRDLKTIEAKLSKDLQKFSTFSDKCPIQYSHFDLHPKNVVLTSEFNFGFLDFESCNLINPHIAWGFSLIKMLRQAMVDVQPDAPYSELGGNALANLGDVEFAKHLDVSMLPISGRFEIARRLAIILEGYFQNNSRVWFDMLPIQIQLLKESYILFS